MVPRCASLVIGIALFACSADEPAGEGDMELSDKEAQAIIDLADKLRAVMGDGGEEAEMDMGQEDDLDAPEGGDAEMEMDAEEEPMMEEEHGDDEEPESLDEDAIVAEVARRVAERLQTNKTKENIVDQLAERIMKRLAK